MAIALVMMIHFGQGYPVHSTLATLTHFIVAAGWCGVDLFFVLSGFLITGILLDTRETPGYFRNFYSRRVLRIFPLYYLALAIAFMVIPLIFHTAPPQEKQRFAYALYFQNWLPLGQDLDQIRYFWSLAVEEQFYLVWPLVVWLLPRRVLGFLCLALALAAFSLRSMLTHFEVNWFVSYAITPARMDCLALGAAVAVVFRSKRFKPMLDSMWLPVLSVGLGLTVSVFVLAGGPHQWHPLVQTFGYSFLGVAFAALVAGAARKRAGLFELTPLRWLGKYSYALYIVHPPIFTFLYGLVFTSGVTADSGSRYMVVICAAVTLSLAVAVMSYFLLERPILSLKRYFVPATAEESATLVVSR